MTNSKSLIPEETSSEEKSEGKKRALSMIELETIIKRYLKDIAGLKEDVRAQKEMFDDAFDNDVKYKETADKVKEVTKVKNAVKQAMMKDPAIVTTSEKIKELKDEMKNLQDALSNYVQEYQRVSGASQIEGEDGEVLEIVHTVKLVKKSKFRP